MKTTGLLIGFLPPSIGAPYHAAPELSMRNQAEGRQGPGEALLSAGARSECRALMRAMLVAPRAEMTEA